MANVFDDSVDDDEQVPSVRVASALRGGDEDEAPEDTPQAVQPQQAGNVDLSAQSYLVPAEADEDTTPSEPAPQGAAPSDVPVSADTKAYATPIPAPVLAKYGTYADHSADQGAMVAQRQAESQQNVKPSIGRRILAGLAGGAVAFGDGDGEKVVQEVLNRPAQQAQQHWAQQEAPIQAKIDADKAADAAVDKANAVTTQQNIRAEQDFRNQSLSQQNTARAQDYQAQAEARKNEIVSFTPDDPKNPYAGGTGTTADGRTVKGVPPPDKWLATWEKNPENVANAQAQKGVATLAALEKSGVKLTPEQRAIVASGGKVTPSVHTNINIREGGGAGDTPAGERGPSEIIAKNMQDKQAYLGSITHNDDGTMTDEHGNPVTQQQYQDRIEKFRTDLNANPVMRKSGTMVDAQGNTVSNRFSRNPQVAPPAPPAAPKPPQQPAAPVYRAKSGASVTVNTRVVVNGRPGVVTGFDAKGKPIVKY